MRWPSSPFSFIHEPFTGAWQKNVTSQPASNLVQFSAVYACVTGIASDVAKMRVKLCREDGGGIWVEIKQGSPWLPVLRRPNHYQTRIEFIEQWILSKLLHGNAYVLKERDARGVVHRLYVLHPMAVKPLVADDGSVFYQLSRDPLSQITVDDVVPASEIIHDKMTPLWHPLVGVSPLYACALASTLGTRAQSDQAQLFENHSIPAGVISGPQKISKETATRMEESWRENYGGENRGRVAVLGDDLKFQAMRMTAEQEQLAEQLQWAVEDVARAFHYPLYKLTGKTPPYAGNLQALATGYYMDCLQPLIESCEEYLDRGLDLPVGVGTEFDLDGLMRMDTEALFKSNSEAVRGGWMAPNEARNKANLPKVTGGDSAYLQQQNYSLEALAKRDAQEDPFASPTSPTSQPEPAATPPEQDEDTEERAVDIADMADALLRREYLELSRT